MTLQEISDRMEIQELMVEYSYAIDTRDWDALDDVFTPDAVIDYMEMAGFKGNLAETKAFLANAMTREKIPNCQHIISTSKIKIEGDRAHGNRFARTRWWWIRNGHVMLLGLWYIDEFVRTPKGWRIAKRGEENTGAITCRKTAD